MAVTQHTYTGNGSTTDYSFTFPYLDKADVQVKVNGATQATSAYSFANATTVRMGTAPSNGDTIIVFRNTNNDDKKGTFYAGSAIKAEDLNDNFDQILYVAQEVDNNAMSTLGTTQMQGDLELGKGMGLVFEGATINDFETRLTVVDPTADRVITLPNFTGTVVTTGDTATVTSTMIADATIVAGDLATNSVTTAKITDVNVTTAKIADDAVTSAKIADGTIVAGNIADTTITGGKLVNDTITATQIANNAVTVNELADDSVNTASIINSAVTTAKINNDAITGDKIANDSINSEHYVDGSIDTAHIGAGQVTTDRIANTNITEALLATNAVSTVKITDSAVTTDKINNNAVTAAKIANDTITATQIAANAITASELADNAVDEAAIATDAVSVAKIADAELTTLAGMQSGTASVLADSTALAATTTEINGICDGMTKQATLTDSDVHYPTSGAVVDYVEAQLLPFGGFEVVATEVLFPNTQPVAGVVISISDAGGVVFNGSGVSTTGRTAGGSTVTINGAPSSLYSETLAAGVGLMVSSTGSSQTYNYHKILGKEDDIKQLSDDINDFNARYRVASSAPGSSNDAGDLYWDTSTNKMKVYNATTSAWDDVAQSSSSHIVTLSEAFDGSRTDFTMSTAATDAQSTIVSINGVIQKPNAGTSTPSEGFAISSNTLKLSNAPASGSDYFVVVLGDTVSIGTPSDNTVDADILQSGCVTTAKIAADAVDGTKIADDAVGAEHIETLDSHLLFADDARAKFGTGSDLHIYHNGSNSVIREEGTGNLNIQTTGGNVDILVNTTETAAKFISDGAVELYHDNAKKLETTNAGGTLTGALTITNELNLIDGTTNASRYIDAGLGDSNSLVLRGCSGGDANNETLAQFTRGGAAELYYDNVKKLETTADGIQVTGKAFVDRTVTNTTGDHPALEIETLSTGTADDDFATGIDFKAAGTAVGRIAVDKGGDLTYFTDAAGGEVGLKIIDDGAVELYHNNVKKLDTYSGGINIYGDVDMPSGGITIRDSEKFVAGTGDDLQIYHDGSQSVIKDTSGKLQIFSEDIEIYDADAGLYMDMVADGAVNLYYDGTLRLATASSGADVTGRLYVSDYIQAADHILIADSKKLQFGAGYDLQIYHDGSNSYIKDNGTGWLVLDSDNIRFNAGNGEVIANFAQDAGCDLYYNGNVRVQTTDAGCTVTGSVTETSDIALKTNIEPIDNVLDKIQQITGYKYQFKNTGHNSMGVTAQDVEKVFPELVHGEEGTKTLQYSGLIGALIESVKELSNKVAALEAK